MRGGAGAPEQRGSRLIVRRGDPRALLPTLARELRADLVTWNRDASPYALRRDAAVRDALLSAGVRVRSCKDRTLFEADELRTQQGRPYTVYTPFRRAWWRRFEAEPPAPAASRRLPPPPHRPAAGALPTAAALGAQGDLTALPPAGEEAARRRLRSFLSQHARHYGLRRDFPALRATSRLSPYLRFGALSVRTCFHEAREAFADAAPAARGCAVRRCTAPGWRRAPRPSIRRRSSITRRDARRRCGATGRHVRNGRWRPS